MDNYAGYKKTTGTIYIYQYIIYIHTYIYMYIRIYKAAFIAIERYSYLILNAKLPSFPFSHQTAKQNYPLWLSILKPCLMHRQC